jgi:hypothetical protein
MTRLGFDVRRPAWLLESDVHWQSWTINGLVEAAASHEMGRPSRGTLDALSRRLVRDGGASTAGSNRREREVTDERP